MLAGVVKAAKEKWTPKVEVCFKVSAVYDVDTKAGVFGVDFVLMLGWTSELIYLEDGKTFSEDMFVPTVFLDNAISFELVGTSGQGHGGKFGLDGARVDKFIDDGEGKLVKLKSTQRYRALMRTFFKVDLFPYDVHLLPITIEARSLGGAGKRVKVKLVDPGPSRPEGHTIAEHANWLPEYTVYDRLMVYRPDGKSKDDQYTVALAVQRDARNVAWNVALPFTMIQSLTFVTFGYEYEWLHDRETVTLSLLLTAVAFKFVVKENLPSVPYLTILDRFVLSGFIMLYVQGFMHLVLYFMYENFAKKRVEFFNNCFAIIFVTWWSLQHLLPVLYGAREKMKLLQRYNVVNTETLEKQQGTRGEFSDGSSSPNSMKTKLSVIRSREFLGTTVRKPVAATKKKLSMEGVGNASSMLSRMTSRKHAVLKINGELSSNVGGVVPPPTNVVRVGYGNGVLAAPSDCEVKVPNAVPSSGGDAYAVASSGNGDGTAATAAGTILRDHE